MSPNEYRHHAAECLKCAFKAVDPGARAFLRRMAIAWSDLADQAEKNGQSDMVLGATAETSASNAPE
jgi:hypothetical protein